MWGCARQANLKANLRASCGAVPRHANLKANLKASCGAAPRQAKKGFGESRGNLPDNFSKESVRRLTSIGNLLDGRPALGEPGGARATNPFLDSP